MVLAHLSKSNSRTFQRLSNNMQRIYKKTELNQTDTFISIYKQVQFTFDNSTPSSINQRNWNYQKNSANASIVVTESTVMTFKKIKFKHF